MSLWLNTLEGMSVEPPASVSAWLTTPTSITEKAKSSCHGVRLQLLGEHWNEKNKEFVREILMFCDEKPAWYAQTLIPEKTYERRAEQFKHLKERPLGTILFSDPHITREDFYYAYLTPTTSEYQQAIYYYRLNFPTHSIPASLWARKSIFHIDGQPLYLMEIFFPDMFGETT